MTARMPKHNPRRHRSSQSPDVDPYRSDEKLPEPAACPDCAAVLHRGRWTWMSAPEDADPVRCPACRRIADGVPAGVLTVKGPFYHVKADELLKLIQHVAERTAKEHPLARILRIETERNGATISTTDKHLIQGIGDALRQAFPGSLTLNFFKQQPFARATFWLRDGEAVSKERERLSGGPRRHP